jgi:hypothetical protein
MTADCESRPLSFFESMQQQASKHLLSSTIYCWARGTGPVEFKHVDTAMRVLHDRHPLLRSRIDGEPGEYRFVPDVPFEHIPVHEITIGDGEDLNTYIEDQMNTPFPGEERTWGGRFIRSTSGDHWWLLLETHHSITDGRAAYHLIDQCGQLLERLVNGLDVDIEPMPMPAAIEFQLDPPGTMERWKQRQQVWSERIGSISKWSTDGNADFIDRRSRNAFTVHDEAFSRRLTERCHAERTTVQGALAAAVVRGISSYLGQTIDIDTLTPVDLRRFADVEIEDREVACKITCLDTGSFGVSSDGDPWEIARAYTTAIGVQLNEAHYPPLDFTREDITSSVSGWKDVDGRHTHGFCLTNTGLLPLDGDYGPVQFETVDITAACRFGGFPFLLSVYSYRGRLRCAYTWSQPTTTRAHAIELTKAIDSHLRAMVE